MESSASSDLNPVPKPKWQWKSNSDPWSKTEEPQWKSYSPEHNYLIEKTYHEKQIEVDIGDYIVSIQHMLQNKKMDLTSQRPIRRVNSEEVEEEEDLRSERYFETEIPKTIKTTNKIFGDLAHFITFFARRNPEILDLNKKFQEFEKSNDSNGLNEILCPKLISCLEKELLEPIEDQLKDDSLTKVQKNIKLKAKKQCEELISLFKKEFASFEEFYGDIFKSYTMKTNLFANLNKHLRNESWIEIENLLPYAICLCKAFFSFKEKKLEASSIILFRGAALHESMLSSYQVGKIFSWNSVTSTTTTRKVAEDFMHRNFDIPNKKYPVLFEIEIPIADISTKSEYLKWIDIKKYSILQNEDEVILAPGSSFEIVETSTDEKQKTTIRLKFKHEVETLAHEGLIMQGAFQNEMIDDKQIKIMCLGGKELSETLESISGNRLIEEIEFCLCKFNSKSLEKMLNVLPTLEKAKTIKFVSCKYEDKQGIIPSFNVKDCHDLNIEMSGFHDFYKIFNIQQDYLKSWKTLNLNLKDLRKHNMKEANSFFCQGLRNLTQLTSLTLDFDCCQEITDEEVKNLASQGLKYLTQLTSLNINFNCCFKLKDNAVSNLASQGLRQLTQLTSLSLTLPEITNQGLSILVLQGLKYLTQLTSLNISIAPYSEKNDKEVESLARKGLIPLIDPSSKINDEAVNNLASHALQRFTHLTSLTLDLTRCEKITNEGVCILASQGLRNLAQLTSLTLRFYQIEDEGIANLASKGLRNLTNLTSLHLNFFKCSNLTDMGINNLASQGLHYLIQLSVLNLNFYDCDKIGNDGISDLASEGLQYLTRLTSLQLRFSIPRKLDEEGVNDLCYYVFFFLKQLTSLDFDFVHRTDKEQLKEFASQAFGYLPKLKSLLFNNQDIKQMDDGFYQISEEERYSKENLFDPFMQLVRKTARNNLNKYVNSIIPLELEWRESEESIDVQQITPKNIDQYYYPIVIKSSLLPSGLEDLKDFTSSTLFLSICSEIPDEGVHHLISQGLKNHTQLTSLSLNFDQITDEGMNLLASEGIKHLTQLTSLTLKFRICFSITDEGLSKLASEGLRYLSKLTSLALHFRYSLSITDKGVNELANEGLKYLTDLTSLNLKFSQLKDVTDEGMNCLASNGLKNLTKLVSLDFSFPCSRITDKGMNCLVSKGIQYLTELTSLTLNFQKCSKLTNKGVEILASQGLKFLTKLNCLAINLAACSEITDQGIKIFVSQGFKCLSQLTSLILSFARCDQITDEGVNSLTYYGVKRLVRLEHLALSFEGCKVTEFTVSNIIRSFHYFGFLLEEEIWDPFGFRGK